MLRPSPSLQQEAAREQLISYAANTQRTRHGRAQQTCVTRGHVTSRRINTQARHAFVTAYECQPHTIVPLYVDSRASACMQDEAAGADAAASLQHTHMPHKRSTLAAQGQHNMIRCQGGPIPSSMDRTSGSSRPPTLLLRLPTLCSESTTDPPLTDQAPNSAGLHTPPLQLPEPAGQLSMARRQGKSSATWSKHRHTHADTHTDRDKGGSHPDVPKPLHTASSWLPRRIKPPQVSITSRQLQVAGKANASWCVKVQLLYRPCHT